MNWIPTNNDLSYYPLLKEALDATHGDVIECGMGHGSTPMLKEYCKDRMLYSYETSKEWADKFTEGETNVINIISDWRDVYIGHKNASVIFIDHYPGEDRKQMIEDFKDMKGILVCHDTELGQADHGYRMRGKFNLFKYVVDVKTNGAWASAMSNHIDITQWVGKKYGDYEISAYDPNLKSDRIDD